MKKLIAMLLALVMTLSLCVACGGGNTATNNGGNNSGNNGGEAEGPIKLTVGLPTKATVLSYEENALTYWLEEQCNVDLSFVPYSGGTDIGTQISTTVAAQQELPDILFAISLGDEVYRGYGRDGYFRDLTPLFDDKEGASKTFWTRLEETFTEAEIDDVLRKITDPDTGKIFGVPTMDTTMIDVMDYQMWINQTWLDKLNLEMPTDLDSFYKVLKAFKEKDPNGNGKADEIPLYGGQEAGLGGDVVNWLVNNFLYFNDRKNFSIDEDGQVYAPFITNEYREALKFINKLIDEGLMLDSVFNTKMSEMPMITTPASGTAIVGCFSGHLTIHADYNNDVMLQYKSMPIWSCAVFNDHRCNVNNFITSDCDDDKVAKAFEVMMTIWSEEGSRRVRYGEYGVNWTDADEGAVSDLGLPASFKLLLDPLMQQNTCLWSGASCTLCVWAELEDAQVVREYSPGEAAKQKMHAESYANFKAAAEKYNPPAEQICPTLVYTEEEKDDTQAQRTACADYYKKSRTDFATGDMDPNSDSDWNKYVDTLWDLGLQDWLDVAQVAYDRY